MNFYYHLGENLCAEEKWVAEYLVNNGEVETEEEAIVGLHSCREFHGWIDCEVSNTIEELINEHYGVV
jgi:hypothetical protein